MGLVSEKAKTTIIEELNKPQDKTGKNVIVVPSIMTIRKCEPNPKLLLNTLNYCSYWCDKTRDRKKTCLIPLSFQSDIDGSGDVLRLCNVWLTGILNIESECASCDWGEGSRGLFAEKDE